VEHPEWLEDRRFKSAAGLVKHADARIELMASVLRTCTTSVWLERLDAAQVPCAPILTREELLEHPQIIENGLIIEDEHPYVGRMRQARPPERFDRTPSEVQRPAPLLGEHTEEVLGEIGLGRDEIASLRDAGVIASPEPR
jgi:crotonobetainyl-CoA:carnitine CoA-transferase CaiB-like acyl-CoA transferase